MKAPKQCWKMLSLLFRNATLRIMRKRWRESAAALSQQSAEKADRQRSFLPRCARSMAYLVRILQPAERDAEEIYQWMIERAPLHGPEWFNGLHAAIQSLRENPERCSRAPESKAFKEDIRQLLYGKRRGVYRVLFR